MELITEKLLSVVSDWSGKFAGAYNIRENGQCAGRATTENIDIITKTDKPGIDIKIKPNTKKRDRINTCMRHQEQCGRSCIQ